MTSQIQQFAETATKFCAWAEGLPQSPKSEAMVALQLLSELYQQGLELAPVFGDEETSRVSHEDWSQIHKRFSALPFNYYMQCASPQNVPDDVPGVADLADDLADIWRDLKSGLAFFNAGHIQAAGWEWRQSFWQNWGHHAAGGIFALHHWVSQHSQDAG
jgi:Domain of unknown function (DUF5063)